jgi:hypothetical protein
VWAWAWLVVRIGWRGLSAGHNFTLVGIDRSNNYGVRYVYVHDMAMFYGLNHVRITKSTGQARIKYWSNMSYWLLWVRASLSRHNPACTEEYLEYVSTSE